MKKRNRLILAIVVLAILAAAYAGVLHLNKTADNTTETDESDAIVLNEVNTSTITAFSYTISGTTLSFTKDGDNWYSDSDKNFPLSQDGISAMVEMFGTVEATRKISSPEALSEYGLDVPPNIISYTTSGQSQQTFYIGNENSATSEYYVKITGDDAVYTLAAVFPESFMKGLYDLAEMTAIPTIDSTTITNVQLAQRNRQLLLSTDEMSSTGWVIGTSADDAAVASSTSSTTFLSTITGLSFKSGVAYNCSDMSVYGLDTPTASIAVSYAEKQTTASDSTGTDESDSTDSTESTESEADSTSSAVTVNKQLVVYLGNTDSNGDYYACLKGSKEVHTISGSIVSTILGYKVTDLMDSHIAGIDFEDVTGAQVTIDGDMVYQVTKEITSVTEDGANAESSESGSGETVETGSETAESAADETSESAGSDETAAADESSEAETSSAETVETWKINDTAVALTDFTAFYSKLSSMTAEQILEKAAVPTGIPSITIVLKLTDGTLKTISFTPYDSSFQLAQVDGVAQKLVNKRDVETLVTNFEALLQQK